MTVKELEDILCTIKDKDLKVCMQGICPMEVNGYFYELKEKEEVLTLSYSHVQPRTSTI